MGYVLKNGQGSLFRNKNKTADNHPNARGELMIDGTLYEIASWTKDGKDGKFQSLSVKRKEVGGTRPRTSEAKNSYGEDFDDNSDLPF